MRGPPKRRAPAGVVTGTGAGTSVGAVQGSCYQETESHSSDERSVEVRQERGFVRLIVSPEPAGGCGLPSTYSSMGLALLAAERLRKERGWNLVGEGGNV